MGSLSPPTSSSPEGARKWVGKGVNGVGGGGELELGDNNGTANGWEIPREDSWRGRAVLRAGTGPPRDREMGPPRDSQSGPLRDSPAGVGPLRDRGTGTGPLRDRETGGLKGGGEERGILDLQEEYSAPQDLQLGREDAEEYEEQDKMFEDFLGQFDASLAEFKAKWSGVGV
ncbi:hypothetical protein T484DRAFT_1888313, partial [Baffinella frigidus]